LSIVSSRVSENAINDILSKSEFVHGKSTSYKYNISGKLSHL